jgi:hypothetical protein
MALRLSPNTAPTLKFIAPMNDDIVGGRHYQALKRPPIVRFEQELVPNGQERA